MFTGIISEIGVLATRRDLAGGMRLQIERSSNDRLERGESIAVNGVCLTALPGGDLSFEADLSSETLARTTLGGLPLGTAVNLERALAVGDRLGGHIVQGHIDAVGSVISIVIEGEFSMFRWSFPEAYKRLVVPKGSIAIDGISLTIVDPDESSLGAAIIPETLQKTNLRDTRVGDRVNLEFDLFAKYAQQLLAPYSVDRS